ncbi:MAG: hypothetical protein KatS3mg109_1585 [Pirellulaceae bacterium]|nr:MAG: hypothetical protein KatS3mg109_1585 [Pirellulaceae bacterium]GIW93380.1 MAG: hypothetical protein KatS3mg110_1421 [Pirellulaceae bacterium]
MKESSLLTVTTQGNRSRLDNEEHDIGLCSSGSFAGRRYWGARSELRYAMKPYRATSSEWLLPPSNVKT